MVFFLNDFVNFSHFIDIFFLWNIFDLWAGWNFFPSVKKNKKINMNLIPMSTTTSLDIKKHFAFLSVGRIWTEQKKTVGNDLKQ